LLLIFITAAFVLVSFFTFYRHRVVTTEQFVIYRSYHFYSNAQVLHKLKSKQKLRNVNIPWTFWRFFDLRETWCLS